MEQEKQKELKSNLETGEMEKKQQAGPDSDTMNNSSCCGKPAGHKCCGNHSEAYSQEKEK